MVKLKKEYVLIKINDQRQRTQKQIEQKLIDFNRHYVNCVDGKNTQNIINFFNDNPEIKETRPMRYGYIGHWLTFINIFKYIVENNIDQLLVLEDDAILSETFIQDLEIYLSDLPEDYDFFMIYQSLAAIHNCVFSKKELLGRFPLRFRKVKQINTIHTDWDIGSKYIVRAYQSVGSVGQIISYSGAKKMLELTIQNGLGSTRYDSGSLDEVLYVNSKKGILNGYQPNPYSGLNKMITIENPVKGTDTETQLQGTDRIELDKLLGISNGETK
jgi:GR25 family glycosyltransferase involved in LPS biosynthesis